MSEPDRRPVFVHLLPALIPPGTLKGGVAVVVDVLRATTVMVRALASGAEAIIPCVEIDEARAVAAGLPAGSAVLGGERQGLPIEGFDLGNSPGDYTPEVCRGKTVVMTTTNGTRAILASLEADRVVVASFANLGATRSYLRDLPNEVHLVCSGTDGRISLEDSLLAGAFASGLRDRGSGNDEAEIVLGLWDEVTSEGDDVDGPSLTAWLARGRGGRRVRQIGLGGDLREAASFDSQPFVAPLRRDPLRIVREAIVG